MKNRSIDSMSKVKVTGKSMAKQIEDYAVTLDIKNNVIAELQNNINKYSTVLLKASKITPLTEIALQLFWASADMAFNEKNSLSHFVGLTDTPSIFSFALPVTENIDFIRFDLGNSPGFINIHEIEIKNIHGEILWKWDKFTIKHKEYLFLFENEELWPGKIVHLSTWIDPQFIISTNKVVQKQAGDSINVEISLSSVNPQQFELINNIAIPFSNVSEKQFKEIQQRNITLERAEELNTQIKETLKTNEQLIEQLVSDKRVLLSEITSKNDVLNRNINLIADLQKTNQTLAYNLTSEINNLNQVLNKIKLLEDEINVIKQKNKEVIISKEKITLELSEKIALLNKRVTENDTVISSHVYTIDKLEQAVKNKDTKMLELNSTVNTLSATLSSKEDVIAGIQKDNQNLKDKLKDELYNAGKLSDKIKLLDENIVELEQKNIELLALQNAKANELANSKEEISLLNKKIMEFETNYIKTTLFKAMVNKLKNK